jgi:hypothetical protein
MPTVKNVGEPCAGEPHARIDGGREETGTSRQVRAEPGASRLPDQPPTIGAARVLPERSNRAARAPAGVCVVAGRSQGGGRRPDRSNRERRADGVIAGVAKA